MPIWCVDCPRVNFDPLFRGQTQLSISTVYFSRLTIGCLRKRETKSWKNKSYVILLCKLLWGLPAVCGSNRVRRWKQERGRERRKAFPSAGVINSSIGHWCRLSISLLSLHLRALSISFYGRIIYSHFFLVVISTAVPNTPAFFISRLL